MASKFYYHHILLTVMYHSIFETSFMKLHNFFIQYPSAKCMQWPVQCKVVHSAPTWTMTVVTPMSFDWRLVILRLCNFIVTQMKYNRFLLPNEHTQRIFWYLLRWFEPELSNITLGLFSSESIFQAEYQLNLPENNFLIWISN